MQNRRSVDMIIFVAGVVLTIAAFSSGQFLEITRTENHTTIHVLATPKNWIAVYAGVILLFLTLVFACRRL